MKQRAIFPSSWAWRSSLALMAIVCAGAPADAREATRLDIAAGALPQSIAELARQAGISIGWQAPLPPIHAPQLHGTMGVAQALRRLLGAHGLVARQVGPTAWRIERAPLPSIPPSRRIAPPLAPSEPESAPIVVTAAKQTLTLDRAPFAVAVIRPDERAAGAQAELGSTWFASNVEGLSLTGLGPGRNRLFVRGVADSPFNGQNQSTVAILLDEARLTYAAPDPDVRLVDVERVELLKGPQGSLYGTGALGGVYKIVTHRPDVDAASFVAEAGAETTWHGELGNSASAVVNLPLKRGTAALRVLGYTALEPGWIDTGARSDSNDTRIWGGRATLRSALGEQWRADLTGFVQFLNSRDSQYVYAPGARARPGQLPEPHDNDLSHIALRVERTSGAINVHLSSAITWHHVGDKLDATVGADSFGLSDPGRLNDERVYRLWDSELRLEGALGKIRWLGGVAHLEATQRRELTLSARTRFAKFGLSSESRVSSDSAVFGQMSLPLTRGLELTAGGRLFLGTTELERGGALRAGTDDRRRAGFTPTAALAWLPRDGRLIFLRYGSAFRQGELSASMASVKVLDGDELQTLEAGVRETLGRHGRLELGIYCSNWDDLQSDALGPDGLIGTVTAGRARIVGAETSLDYAAGDGWHLLAGAVVQSARLVRSELGVELEDRHLPVVPTFTLRSALGRTWTPGRVPLNIQGEVRYVGPARLSFDPALDRRVGNVLETRFAVGVQSGPFALALQATNLFDGEANTFALGNPLRVLAGRQYIPQKPRTLALTLRLSGAK